MTLWTLSLVKCGGDKTGDQLHQVGALWKGSEIFEGKIWYHSMRNNNAMNVWTKTMYRYYKIFALIKCSYELWISLNCTSLLIVGLTKNYKKIKKFSFSLPMIIDVLIKNYIPPPTYACFYILRYMLLS